MWLNHANGSEDKIKNKNTFQIILCAMRREVI